MRLFLFSPPFVLQVTDEGVATLSALTALTSLALDGVLVDFQDGSAPQGLSGLRALSLSGCIHLSTAGLRHLTGLTKLNLSRCSQVRGFAGTTC